MRLELQRGLLGAKGRGATTCKRGGVSEASRRMRMQVEESLIVGSDAQDMVRGCAGFLGSPQVMRLGFRWDESVYLDITRYFFMPTTY